MINFVVMSLNKNEYVMTGVLINSAAMNLTKCEFAYTPRRRNKQTQNVLYYSIGKALPTMGVFLTKLSQMRTLIFHILLHVFSFFVLLQINCYSNNISFQI